MELISLSCVTCPKRLITKQQEYIININYSFYTNLNLYTCCQNIYSGLSRNSDCNLKNDEGENNSRQIYFFFNNNKN